jgi:hypothetical protein
VSFLVGGHPTHALCLSPLSCNANPGLSACGCVIEHDGLDAIISSTPLIIRLAHSAPSGYECAYHRRAFSRPGPDQYNDISKSSLHRIVLDHIFPYTWLWNWIIIWALFLIGIGLWNWNSLQHCTRIHIYSPCINPAY